MEVKVKGQIVQMNETDIETLEEYTYSDHLYRKARKASNNSLMGADVNYGHNIDIYIKNDCISYLQVFRKQLMKDPESLSIVEELLATNDIDNHRIAKEILDKMDKELDIK